MANVFRGKKFGIRLILVLSITLLVVFLQILSVNKISSPTPYPWEKPDFKGEKRDGGGGRDLRNVQTEVKKHVIEEQPSHHEEVVTKLHIKDSSISSPPPTSPSLKITLPSTSETPHISSKSPSLPSKSSPPSITNSPLCSITSKDALSALQRAKTDECKHLIQNISCLGQANKLYDTNIRNICPIGRNPIKAFNVIPYEHGVGPLPRVVFLLSIHGRAIRQIQRLFKTIYHADHFYYIHVDARSDFLYREVIRMIGDYPNVHIPKWQMTTIWGGSSLLKMLLRALEDLEYKLSHWKWDFFINLSESDYPLKTNDELVQFLRVHRQSNFVKTHGGDINRFIQKQGLDRTFVECDNHMWRIGNRQLPPDITIDGGSDWIAINRNYSTYLVTNKDPFLLGLKKYYEYSLLPAESFFHTVLRNGPLCSTIVRSNLRITNWNRKLGCLCQYKHIVDWCGCSPNDFLPKDISKLKNPGPQNFFARKFEAIINQQVINELHSHMYGPYPDDVSSLSSYWQNIYHNDDILTRPSSAHFTAYHSFMRKGIKNLQKIRNTTSCPSPPAQPFVKEVHVFHREDSFVGVVLKLQDSAQLNSPLFEILMKPKSVFEVRDQSSDLSKRITAIEVGSEWDGKERIFRNYGSILGVHDTPAIALRLQVGILGHVTVVWENPIGIIIEKHDIKLEPSLVVTHQKLKQDRPLMPGIWKVWIEIDRKVYILQSFLIIPAVYDHNTLLNNPVAINAKRIDHDIAKKGGELAARYIQWTHNIVKTGAELNDWVDVLLDHFWELQSICCTTSSCKVIPSCEETYWSSLYPDQKSELGPVQPDGRILT